MTEAKKQTPPLRGLYRSETNKIIAGVCGGLGEYFNIDPTIIRIIFILITIFAGSGILIYIILWLVIPSESTQHNLSQNNVSENLKDMKKTAEKFAHDIGRGNKSEIKDKDSKAWWGFLIILLGLAFLLNNYGIFDFSETRKLWPIILIILGLSIFLRK